MKRVLFTIALLFAGLAFLPNDTAMAAGTGQYSSPQWFPLRHNLGGGAIKIGCTYLSSGSQGGYNCADAKYPNGYHTWWALDLLADVGTPVYPSGAGQVTQVRTGNTGCSATSNYIQVYHGNGMYSYYTHLNAVNVGVGSWVDMNSVIGTVGKTGLSAEGCMAHLHYETRNGTSQANAVDPGQLRACHGGGLVTYPQAWGLSSWKGIPWGTRFAVNDGTTCSASSYARHIVQWNADTKSPKTSWFVTPDLRRLWIPDSATYNCLKSHGAPGPDALSAGVLDQMPDLGGRWAPCGNQMWSSRELRRGMSLTSVDGRFTISLQNDGNFVLSGLGRVLWASNHAADFVLMQSDGNLVGYTNAGGATWSTGTSSSGANHLVVQSDGNLVLYTNDSHAVWSSHTRYAGSVGHIVQWSGDTKTQKTAWYVTPDFRRLWIPDGATYNCLKGRGVPGPDQLAAADLDQLPDQQGMWMPCGDTMAVNRELRRNMSLWSSDGHYRLVLQGDGNFVAYGSQGPIWANNRFNTDFVVMQNDGNLVGYTNGGAVTWATNTAGSGGARLVMQSDGNLVIYNASGAVWASNTAGRP